MRSNIRRNMKVHDLFQIAVLMSTTVALTWCQSCPEAPTLTGATHDMYTEEVTDPNSASASTTPSSGSSGSSSSRRRGGGGWLRRVFGRRRRRSTITVTIVTYTCDPGKLFPDGGQTLEVRCDQVPDWAQVAALACVDRLPEQMCFWLTNVTATFEEGLANCQNQSASLAEIFSASDNEAASLVSQYIRAYFGMTDQEEEGVWKTVTGVNDSSYNNWSGGNPSNNNNNEHCAELLRGGLWNDLPCTSKRFAICERPKFDICELAPDLAEATITINTQDVTYYCNAGRSFPDGRTSITIPCPCGQTWDSIIANLTCEERQTGMVCWDEMEASACTGRNGFPATILNSDLNNNIIGKVGRIGLRFNLIEAAWMWVGPWQENIVLDSESYTNWATISVAVPSTEMCATIDSSGEWYELACDTPSDVVCERSKYAVCQDAPDIPNAIKTIDNAEVIYYCDHGFVFGDWQASSTSERRFACTCGIDWTSVTSAVSCLERTPADICFYRLGSAATWHDAHDRCEAAGGALARVYSNAERNRMNSIYVGHGWIAANDIGIENAFHWGLNGPPLQWDRFPDGEPNNVNSADCIVFNPGNWDDVPCEANKHPICEKHVDQSCTPLPNNPNAVQLVELSTKRVTYTCDYGWVMPGGLRQKSIWCCRFTGLTNKIWSYICKRRTAPDICYWGAGGDGGSPVTCSNATSVCAQNQGKLAVVTSAGENEVVGNFGGLFALYEDGGVWEWRGHDEPLTTPTFWDSDPGTGQCGLAQCSDPSTCFWKKADQAATVVCERNLETICAEAPVFSDAQLIRSVRTVRYRCRGELLYEDGTDEVTIACPCLPLTWDDTFIPRCNNLNVFG